MSESKYGPEWKGIKYSPDLVKPREKSWNPFGSQNKISNELKEIVFTQKTINDLETNLNFIKSIGEVVKEGEYLFAIVNDIINIKTSGPLFDKQNFQVVDWVSLIALKNRFHIIKKDGKKTSAIIPYRDITKFDVNRGILSHTITIKTKCGTYNFDSVYKQEVEHLESWFMKYFQEYRTYLGKEFEKNGDYKKALNCYVKAEAWTEVTRVKIIIAKEFEENQNYNAAIETYEELESPDEVIRVTRLKGDDKVKHLDYDRAIEIYESIGDKESSKNARKLQAEQGAVKVTQKVVQGDEITKTEIKDSVLNRSNIGSSGDDKFSKLKELKEMLSEGLIDDDEFKQMKKEILGK